MSFKTPRASSKVARLIAALLGLSMALPGVALANHTDCTQSRDIASEPTPEDCPEFSPDFLGVINNPYIDAPSTINFRWFQADHESSAIDATFFVPKAWRFAMTEVRPGGLVPSPTTQCSDLYEATSPRALAYGEGLSGGVGMQLAVGSASRSIADYGNTSGPGGRKPSLSFLRWNPETPTTPASADLCMYLYSESSAVAGANEFFLPVKLVKLPEDDPTYGWTLEIDLGPIVRNATLMPLGASIRYFQITINAITGGNWNIDAATGKKAPVVFSRTPRDPETTALRGDWTACTHGLAPSNEPSPCRENETLSVSASRVINITPPPTVRHNLDYGRLKGPGGLPGVGGGIGPYAVDGFGVVRGTNTPTISWSQPGVGPDDTIRGYALAVAKTGDPTTAHWERYVTQKFLVDSNNNPTTIPNPEFDESRSPCGADGKAGPCSTKLEFPLGPNGGTVGPLLDGDGKYDLALVTIYADGHRTDGRCDDGTPPGAICDPNLPGITVSGTGISTWQFVMRTKAWPSTYAENTRYIGGCTIGNGGYPGSFGSSTGPFQSYYDQYMGPYVNAVSPYVNGLVCATPGGGGFYNFQEPRFLLFTDWTLREAEFFIWGPNMTGPLFPAGSTLDSVVRPLFPAWSTLGNVQSYTGVGNAQDGQGKSFSAKSITVVGSGDAGVISFGNWKPDGPVATFRFDGVAVPNKAAPCPLLPEILTFAVPSAPIGSQSACGVFQIYDPHNLPPSSVPGPGWQPTGMPSTVAEIFEGQKI